MAYHGARRSGVSGRLERLVEPFPDEAPAAIREPLIKLQYERLNALTPFLYLAIGANAAAMALATMGELALWQQILPPALLIGVSLWRLALWRRQSAPVDTETAWRRLRAAVVVAGGLGLVSGIWSVNAFSETEQYACVVAPVFLALTALVSANCLTSVPRAATVALVTALAPIVIRMLIFDNLGTRAMAVMLVVIALLQSRLVQIKFRETIKMLTLQHEITLLAEADALTGLKNRRAFTETLEARLREGAPVTVAMVDLDGFKAANDTHGHHAGDLVLIEVGERMKRIASSAACIARLGGDEFALVFDGASRAAAAREIEAIRTALGLPYHVAEAPVAISASIGVARAPAGGESIAALMREADRALYREKGRLREIGGRRAA